MPILILIKGPAGSGKSTLCGFVASRLPNFHYINLEEIKESFSQFEREKRKVKSHLVYYPALQKLVEEKRNILVQESFLKDLKDHLDLKDYTIISVFLKVSLEETKQRNSRRGKILSDEYLEKSYSYLAVPEKEDHIIDAQNSTVEEIGQIVLELVDSNN